MTIVKFPARFDFQKMLGAQRLTAVVPAGAFSLVCKPGVTLRVGLGLLRVGIMLKPCRFLGARQQNNKACNNNLY